MEPGSCRLKDSQCSTGQECGATLHENTDSSSPFPFLNTSKMYTALQAGFPMNVRRQQPPAWLGDKPEVQTVLCVLLQVLITSGEIRRTLPLGSSGSTAEGNMMFSRHSLG